MITDQNAQVVSRHDYLPFGEEIPNGSGGRSGNGFGAPSNVNQMFTGQERDPEMAPNADFFNARYFMGVLGGFTRPDPANAGADILNPQSWNAYAYVLGNPLNGVDPSGMWWCDPEDPSCEPDWPPPFFPPCIFFDCGGDGGGGGRGGSGGGANSNTPRSTPLPPNSFPGGETLGLPPGMHVPLPSPAVLLGLNLNLNCEFGVCIATLGIQPAGTNQQVTITNETIHDAIYQIKIPLNLLGPRGNGSEGNPGGRMAVTFQRAAPKTKGYGTYRAYASCYIGNVFANVIGDAPDMYGPGTVAVGIILKLGAKWGPAAVIPPAIAMSARAITTFDSVARGCAALNGYTPWILK